MNKLVKDKPARCQDRCPQIYEQEDLNTTLNDKTMFSIQNQLTCIVFSEHCSCDQSEEKPATHLLTKDAKYNSVRRLFNVYYFVSNGQTSMQGYKSEHMQQIEVEREEGSRNSVVRTKMQKSEKCTTLNLGRQ
ncbi:hypothetical protein F511_25929 [Dorcoceras hygrometricum]|uniref:Uncharacterized protein n=1 Tax=Dorcoceras hygrometricum TaxID=472368 RepID=A0A2Z7BA05_9LAMI|nr:hypothetical protein F511_25929 [Dorcoceras hygrometricum]